MSSKKEPRALSESFLSDATRQSSLFPTAIGLLQRPTPDAETSFDSFRAPFLPNVEGIDGVVLGQDAPQDSRVRVPVTRGRSFLRGPRAPETKLPEGT